ncbi:cytochrome P450 [Flavobacterium psychroterrae]|uniref:Cytochrome P450 n=1 Tax=Flavobacterium psychroterrae TaxID=2133767 RepID=A0ABS5PHL0_9FLAO|nr:cytochrome P450 [Flavobacterium psychroterrae]MBS7233762.1 cytochrome P450 [Flavobacterium psychroterrae]
MLDKNPIYWDDDNKIWTIYSYVYCVQILKNPHAFIPTVNKNNEQKLNKYALKVLVNLTRLSNGIEHEISREIAKLLFSNMKSITIETIISPLIEKDLVENKIDWVNSVCKKLPILILLKSFSFSNNDSDFISDKIAIISKIMLPNKTEEQIKSINEISEYLYLIVENHLSSQSLYEDSLIKMSKSNTLSLDEIKTKFVSNLIGLFIQCYDAGRGILSNSLLQIIKHKTFTDKTEIEKSIIETLRFDPPIHNTRRIANDDIILGNALIKKGDSVLVVLAAANRDLEKFENASIFNSNRINNIENLTFGIGGHQCLAKHFSVQIATETLWYLFENYKNVTVLENNIQYESLINARLPNEIWISAK